MEKRITSAVPAALALLMTIGMMVLCVCAVPVHAATVTNNNDSGAGSLRQAIIDANGLGGAQTISFSGTFGADNPITLLSNLDTITCTPTFDVSGATGIVMVKGGTMNSTPAVIFNGGGTLELNTGASMTDSSTLTVGNTGTATLNVKNGATLSNTVTNIGSSAGSTGTMTVDGGTSSWTNSNQLTVGVSGIGTLNISNGAVVNNSLNGVNIGGNALSTGTMTVDGANSSYVTTAGNFCAGYYGTGVLNITNGGAVSNSATGIIGRFSGSTGTVTVDGANSTWTNIANLAVGFSGNATLNITNGGLVTTTYAKMSRDATSSGTVTVDGANSTWTISSADAAGKALYIGSPNAAATGTLTISNGGLVNAENGLCLLASLVGSSGTLNIGNNSLAGTINTPIIAGGSGTANLNFKETDASYTFSPQLTGSLRVNQTGTGKTILTGANTHTGLNTITAGTLAAGNVNALGTGAVTNNATLDIGSYALNVVGIYTQSLAASTLKVAIDGVNNGSITATAAPNITGGILDLTISNYVPNNTPYTIIDAAAAGTYTGVTITDNSAVLAFAGASSGNDFVVTATRANPYNTIAANSNEAAAGSVLEAVGAAGATGDMLNVLNTLDGESSKNVGNALDTMTPDVSSGTAEGSRALTSQGITMIANRLGGARSGFVGTGVSAGEMLNGVGVWMQGLGSNMKQDERKGIQGFSANTFGTTIGADKVIDKHFRAGFAGSYGWAGVHSKQPGSPSDDINSFQGTIYGSYDSLDLNKARQGGKKSYEAVRSQVENSWYVDGMFAFTQNNYDSRREIWLTPTNKRVAKADHYGQQYSTNFETGYTFTFEETKKLEVTPFAGLGYNYLYMNKYKEKGANALNLSVQGEGYHQLEQSLGMKLAYPMVAKKLGTFIPSAKAAWLYDYIGDRFQTTATFAGGGPSFDTIGAKPAKNGMLFGAELGFLNKGNVTLTGNWDLELRDQFMSNTYYGTVRYDF